MRYTVRYIPLRKIKPGEAPGMTARLRKLRALMWDSLHLIVVRRNRRDGSYSLLLGRTRYDYLLSHTKRLAAPCLIDDSPPRIRVREFGRRVRAMIERAPALSIIRALRRADPRFGRLTRRQQLQVLLLAIRYRETVVAAMIAAIDRIGMNGPHRP